MEDVTCKVSLKTSASKLAVRGRKEEVKAHTNNVVSVMDPKSKYKEGLSWVQKLLDGLMWLFTLYLHSDLVTDFY